MRLLIIPAAGAGTRLQSSIPKALISVNGRPMIDHLFGLYRDVVDRFVVVLHPFFAAEVWKHCSNVGLPVDYVIQHSPTGMLDAVLCAHSAVRDCRPEWVWISWCDQIAVTAATTRALAAVTEANPQCDLVLPTIRSGRTYIHFERDGQDHIVKVLQRREGDKMPAICENDIGLFSLSLSGYLRDLFAFSADAQLGSVTGERNFLPFVPWLVSRGRVLTFPAEHPVEALGVNTPQERRLLEQYFAHLGGLERPNVVVRDSDTDIESV